MGVVFIAFLLFAYYAFTWRNVSNFQSAIDTCSKPFCDFTSFYYSMGETIFQTKLPIEGFVYSPFIAVLLAIFSLFGLNASLILWGFLQTLSAILYLILFRRLVPSGQLTHLFLVLLALSSFPLLHVLTWGQVGIFTTASILGALFFYERGQRVLAAILLAFAVSFKFFPIIFFVPFLVRRDIRFLLIAIAACATFLIVIPGIFLGVCNTLNFYNALINSYRNFDWVITNYNSQNFPHVVLRLVAATGNDAFAYLPLLRWIGYGIAAINLELLYLFQRARLPHAGLWSFHILFLTIPFVLMTSWPADLVYLPFAQSLLIWQILKKEETPTLRAIATFLIVPSIIVSNIVFFNLLGNSGVYGSVGFIFWANLLLLLASYMELLPSALRQIRTKTSGARLMSREG